MSRIIAAGTRLSDLKREAKRWLKALRAGEPEARIRLERANPSARAEPTLREVQLAIAREHGFPGWSALKAAIEANATENLSPAIARYEQMALNLLNAFRTGTDEAMQRHWNDTWHRRSWQGMRSYVLADLGRPPENQDQQADITADDARFLVAREAGFESWGALSDYASTLPIGKRAPAAKPVRLFYGDVADPDAAAFETTRDWDAAIERMQSGAVTGLDAQGQMTDDLLAEISRCDQLTFLRLGPSAGVSDRGARELARMPQLRQLDLSGCRITDTGLDFLGELTALEVLSLAGTRVSDSGLAALSHCERLERLDLSWTPTGDGAIRVLAGMDGLRSFRSGLLVSDAGIPLLTELPVFRSWRGGEPEMSLLGGEAGPNYLSLRGAFSNAGLAALVRLQGLFALDLHERRLRIDAECLRPLCSLPHLGWLAYQADDQAMSHIAGMPSLRFLLCQDTMATDDGFRALGRSRSLEYLWGGDCENLGDPGFRALSTMPSLRALSVGCGKVSDAALSTLPAFPALRELMPMGVPDEGYRHVGRCAGLESLVLMYCRETTDVATEHVGRLANLTSYFASYTQITDETPDILSRMDSLTRIELVGCAGVSNPGIAKLSRLPRLGELRLSGMQRVTREVADSFGNDVDVHLTP